MNRVKITHTQKNYFPCCRVIPNTLKFDQLQFYLKKRATEREGGWKCILYNERERTKYRNTNSDKETVEKWHFICLNMSGRHICFFASQCSADRSVLSWTHALHKVYLCHICIPWPLKTLDCTRCSTVRFVLLCSPIEYISFSLIFPIPYFQTISLAALYTAFRRG